MRLGTAHLWCGQDKGCGSVATVTTAGARKWYISARTCPPRGEKQDGTARIEDPGTCFMREPACGGGQFNLVSRRGRLPSGCDHSLITLSGHRIRSQPGRPFCLEIGLPLPATCANGSGYCAGRHL